VASSPQNGDAYRWIGASGGLWGLAPNWQDVTAGGSPASAAPDALTPITIIGLTGGSFMAIAGGGVAAGLGLTGNVALGGAYTTGMLSVGARSVAGGGSASVSYVYAAGALLAANLTAGSIVVASGSLGLTGPGSAISVAGTITLGAQSVVGAGVPASFDPGAAAGISLAAGSGMTAGSISVVQGSILVTGPGSSLSVSGLVGLGLSGVAPAGGVSYAFDALGSLVVSGGGVFAAASFTEVVGSIGVDGTGSRFSVQTILTLGLAGAGSSLAAANGGAVQADSVVIQAPATSNPGPAAVSTPSISVDAASAVEVGSGIAAAGTITIDAGKSIASMTDAAITGAIVDNGVLSAAGGNLTLTGNLSGTGVLQIGHNGLVTMNGTVGARNAIAFTDAAATLVIGTDPVTGLAYGIAAPVSGFQFGDSIVFRTAVSSVAYSAYAANLGTLTLMNGGLQVASLTLVGNYTAGSFVLSPTISGGGVVTILPPQTGSGGTASPNLDAYSWIGSTGGYWGVTTNWLDLSGPDSFAQYVPGALTPATIFGATGPAYQVIRGGGASSSLAITGNVDLSGLYTTGALTVGSRIAAGLGSSSVSYVYAGGALIVANTVAAGIVNVTSGILSLAPGAILITSGTITVGSQSAVHAGIVASYDPGGSASIAVAAGASLSSPALTVTQGAVTLGGAGASVLIGGPLSLGATGGLGSFDSLGAIRIANGGHFTVAGTLAETIGSIDVDGDGSRLTVQAGFILGLAGTTAFGSRSLSVTNGGTVQASGLLIQPPVSQSPGTAVIAAASLFVDAISSVRIGTGIGTGGSITIDAGLSIAAVADASITGTIIDNGVLSEVNGNLTLNGSVSGTGQISIGRNGTVTVNGNVAAGNRIALIEAGASLVIGTNPGTQQPYAMAAPISSFQLGDSLGFTVAATGISYAATGANAGALKLLRGSVTLVTVILTGSYSASNFVFSPTTAGGSVIRFQARPNVASSDFNGDGRSDLFWQNNDGTPAIWLMNGMTLAGSAALANPGPSWHLKVSSDFNGDGRADMLWQNDNGTPAIWLMNATTQIGGATLGNPGPSWHIKAAGDFNGDGRADILWQNDNGAPAIWLMNGTTQTGGATLANPGPSWQVKAAGDFNGDGRADILWQNTDGTAAIWLMNGTTQIGGATLANPGASWHIKGSGDFNADGKSDILWQNDDGSVAIWEMNGTAQIASALVGTPGASWHVKGAGDYNGDGRADILYQGDDGSVAIWNMSATSYLGGAIVGNAGTSWHTIGSDAMRFISGATGNGVLAATSEDDMFVLTSYAAGAHAISGFNPAHDLIEFSLAKFRNFAAIQANSTVTSGGTLIALGSGSSLLVQGVLPASLGPGDFRFV
jgi:hypothetical protein